MRPRFFGDLVIRFSGFRRRTPSDKRLLRLPGNQSRKLPGHCLLSIAVFAILFGACVAPPPPQPSAEEIIRQAVDTMSALEGFSFSIDRSGAPAYLDAAETISFRRAEGVYVAPDQAQATVRAIVPGLVAEIRMIAIGEQYWETSLLTGEWTAVPAGQAFNPAALFDAAHGLPAILMKDLYTIAPAESASGERFTLDEVPGVGFYLVVADLDTTDLYPLSFGLIGPEVARLHMWVEPGSFYIHRLEIIEPVPVEGGETTVWQVDFWDFDVVAAVAPPD